MYHFIKICLVVTLVFIDHSAACNSTPPRKPTRSEAAKEVYNEIMKFMENDDYEGLDAYLDENFTAYYPEVMEKIKEESEGPSNPRWTKLATELRKRESFDVKKMHVALRRGILQVAQAGKQLVDAIDNMEGEGLWEKSQRIKGSKRVREGIRGFKPITEEELAQWEDVDVDDDYFDYDEEDYDYYEDDEEEENDETADKNGLQLTEEDLNDDDLD